MCLTCDCQHPMDDHGDSRHITLLDLRCAAEASGIAVTEAASNLTKTLAAVTATEKAVDRSDAFGAVLKADDEKRFLLTVSYPAMKADIARGADGFRDFARPETVEQAAWNFMRKGARAGLWHEPGHSDAAEVVESYLWRADPWAIKAADGTEQVVMPGDWLVGLVLSPPTWTLYKSGQIGGVSVQGRCERRVPDQAILAQLRSS